MAWISSPLDIEHTCYKNVQWWRCSVSMLKMSSVNIEDVQCQGWPSPSTLNIFVDSEHLPWPLCCADQESDCLQWTVLVCSVRSIYLYISKAFSVQVESSACVASAGLSSTLVSVFGRGCLSSALWVLARSANTKSFGKKILFSSWMEQNYWHVKVHGCLILF